MATGADADTFETFDASAAARWDYVQDGVMGGVSSGHAVLADGVLRLMGTVSTENNGGFIQARQRGFAPWPADATGLEIDVRGNGETYFVFLKTPDLGRVTWSFRATFDAGQEWKTVRLPFAAFERSRPEMPKEFRPGEVNSIGFVAFGRDHAADLSIRSIALY